MARKTKAQKKREQQEEVGQWITIVILCALAVIALLRYGIIGNFLYNLQRYLLGVLFWLVSGILVVMILINVMNRHHGNEEKNPAPAILIICAILLLCSYLSTQEIGVPAMMPFVDHITDYFSSTPIAEVGGGIIGAVLYALSSMAFGRGGVIVLIVVLFIITALLIVSLDTYKDAFHTIAAFFATPDHSKEEEPEPEPEEETEPANLWNMIAEHKEKKEQAKLGQIKADADSASEIPSSSTEEKEPEQLSLLGQEEEKPKLTSILNIRADGPTEEIPVVSIPGKVVSDADSVFINVDELQDANEAQPSQEKEESEEPETQPMGKETMPAMAAPLPAKHENHKQYRLPKQTLLDPVPPKNVNGANEMAAREKGQLLINILKNFDIEAELIDTHIGPAVTQFEIRPDVNVKVSKILALTDDIKMQLAARDIRVEAPIPGRNAVGIEVPNEESTPVKMRGLLNDVAAKDKNQPLLFFLGKDLLGRTVTCRLDKMPHLLIAGATGSGKSVCMNSIITSLLMRTKPKDVKMLLIDPKKVEFTPFQKIPHLIGPVINDPTQANNALKVIVRIMDERYNLFAAAGVRNIEVYNQKVLEQNGRPNEDGSPCPKKLPYIVVIIDELADLMVVAGKEVEASVQRITQLARAAGIHLIVATQRPSVDVITGIIKANIPSRIAFSVSSGMDSRTILDHIGAERLLGNGDMLYMPIGQNSATRVQGVFVTDEEVKRIADYVSNEAVPMYDDSFVMLEGINDGDGTAVMTVNDDPLFQEVKDYVIEAQKASTSLLQRRFGIGYNRAARMIDALEEAGVIGPVQGSKPREVFIKPDDSEKKTETGEKYE
ncbi:MAG: DNA translocase FtsK [Erysipelotrichaceae bacterium]|nr:DNA translocase FtsK [Erysipelotrichaceae bacterium]